MTYSSRMMRVCPCVQVSGDVQLADDENVSVCSGTW